MSVVMKSFERLVLAHLKDITGPLLDPMQFAYQANRSVDDAVNMGLHYILQHLYSSGTYPPLQTHPTHCASPHLSVDHKLPDRQEATGEAGEHHIRQSALAPPRSVCSLLLLHQRLHHLLNS